MPPPHRGPAVHEGYDIDILVQGFPGKTVCHGGLGWSTVAMLRGQDRVILIDAGSFNMRRLITAQLAERGLGRPRLKAITSAQARR